METIKIDIEYRENWAGNRYLLYSCEKFGKIAEVDYPTHISKLPRVYCLADKKMLDGRYITLSNIPQALVGAETVCQGYLYDMGYYNMTFNYPKTLKMQ